MSETDTMDFIRHIKGNVSLVTWNALANVLGRLWSSLLSLLSIPIYIHILGAEAFGLIGFFSTFDIIFNFLDFGLSATVNREIARNVTTGADPQKNKVVLRTFESLYWVMGAAIGLVMFSSAGWLTRHWIHIKSLPPGDVQTALTIISFAFFARWPVSLYTGVLRGLQAQVLQNLILVVSSTVRVVGGIAIIIFVFPTIHGYALWYAFAAFLEILLISLTAWNRLNRLTGAAASFDWSVFKNTWNFAFTFNLVGVIGMVVSSADRVVISKLLPLDQLGYYSIAGTATGIMPLISIALMTALFPRFVGQLTQDGQTLFLSFRESVGFLSYVSAGLTFVLIFYAREILWIWTRSDITVTNVYQPLIFLAIANMLNAISNAPYTLLVANGQTRALLVGNCLSLLIYLPLLLPAISSYRLIGGAVLFAMWNCAMLVYYFHLVNRHILFGRLIEMLRMSPLPFGLLCMLCMGLPSLFVPGNIRFIIFIVCAILYLRLGFRLMKSTVILGHA